MATAGDCVRLTPASKLDGTYDRQAELKAFDDTKDGVKGLVDAGVTKIPSIFHLPPPKNNDNSYNISVTSETQLSIPVIDLEDIDKDPEKLRDVVAKVREASETCGFFQLVNHGVPVSVMEEMENGSRRFFEHDNEVKRQYYTRDLSKAMVYNSNFDLFHSPSASWRDSFYCFVAPNSQNQEDLPEVCREILCDYSREMDKLGKVIFELLSEALGLERNHLNEMECNETHAILCSYYPACPQSSILMIASSPC